MSTNPHGWNLPTFNIVESKEFPWSQPTWLVFKNEKLAKKFANFFEARDWCNAQVA